MADELTKKNMYLINAPAGSGKTTTIKRMIRDSIGEDKSTNILCVTFTNRAADELMEEHFPECVEISTIHSFISRFMSIYFSHRAIKDLYFEVYNDAIVSRISNPENDERINESNNKYREKYGKLDLDTIKLKVKRLFYNELDFNALFYGGLCHDDLLSFAKITIERYPILRRRINEKYRYVFIDEYQDTSSDVLDIFYDAIKNTKAELYLFGDKMQQIYKNYDCAFEEKFADFDLSKKLEVNYRSIEPIINVLNRIYNDKGYYQKPSDENKEAENPAKPIVVFSVNIESDIEKYEKYHHDSLTLYIANRKRFSKIGAGGMYTAVSRMERYRFGSKYSVVDVLTQDSKDNPDGLFELLFFLFKIKDYFDNKIYGSVIQLAKHHKMFDNDTMSINTHCEKEAFYDKLKAAIDLLNSDKIIKEVLLDLCESSMLVREKVDEYLTNPDYENVLAVSIIEIRNLLKYLNDPHTSTQHGVKGESHNTVIFVAENSGNPLVKMYEFLRLWANTDITLTEFEKSYFLICRAFENILDSLNVRHKDEIKQQIYTEKKGYIDDALMKLSIQNKHNDYFKNIYQPYLDVYFSNPGVGKLKDCIDKKLMYGIYVAYKLFYVGCSRARENLTVILDKSNVAAFEGKLSEKFMSIGFVTNN